MNVLILNRFRLQTNPYRAWPGPDFNLSLISSPGAFEPGEAERQSRDYDRSWCPTTT